MTHFKNAISHRDERCDVYYETADTFSGIPESAILKAHGACFHRGKMLLVYYLSWGMWGLPGGTLDAGETPLQTLKRELLEESNCEVVSHAPLSYQKVVSPDGRTHYRLLYLCAVKPKGPFRFDPAGAVHKIAWINPEDYAKFIEPKEVRLAVVEDALKRYREQKA